MDIRSRAESLRPFRYLLSRQRDDDGGLGWRGSREPDGGAWEQNAHRWRQAAIPAATAEPAGATAPIAIIGMGCRFPDADDPAGLLDLVLTGRQAFRRLPPCRVDLADYYSADRAAPDATYSARAAVLEGWRFDTEAFGVPEAVYQATDPAHWLALETTARALAAAGFPLGQGLARSRTGVIVGNTLAGDSSRAAALRLRWPYVRRVMAEALAAGDIPRERAIPVLRHAAQRYMAPFPAATDETLAGSTPAAIASRICGYFGFRGGGYAVDGSQASSLLAVASACTSLAAGDLDVAIAGGVDISLDPLELVGMAKTGALARGDMRVYDENPTGFLPGEGCGMVVLMRSADARLNGLPVYAEIAGWGASAAGQASMTVPDAHSQFLALHRAYQRARIAPADVQLIEGHGAGTAAADTTELSALAELRAGAQHVAALGSIKANIGNAKAAAGAAGLIKTVLAMSTGFIPPATGFSKPHPLLRGGQAALRLPREPEPWPEGPRIAGVSAMGPGIDVHVVLRSQPPRGRHERKSRGTQQPPLAETGLIIGLPVRCNAYLLTAPDRDGLDALLARIALIAPWLSDAELGDLACQLARDAANQGPVRMAIVASNQDQLARLAGQGTALLPGLEGGRLSCRPGMYAADGAHGRITLLLSDSGAERDDPGSRPDEPGSADPWRPLSALRWLDRLGVSTTAAVGFGSGELAGLVWAGCLSEPDVQAFRTIKTEIFNAQVPPDRVPGSGSSGSGADAGERDERLRKAVRRLAIAKPRHQLISAALGRPVTSVDDVAEILRADLDCPPGLDQALRTGANEASLLLETGPGQALARAASVLCEVPAVSLGSGSGADAARAAAALFAAGALPSPADFYAGRPSRPIDIWREQIFITNPCQVAPPAAASLREDAEPEPAAAAPQADRAAAAAPAAGRPAAAPAGEPARAEPAHAKPAAHAAPTETVASAAHAAPTGTVAPAASGTPAGSTPALSTPAASTPAASGTPAATPAGPRPAPDRAKAQRAAALSLTEAAAVAERAVAADLAAAAERAAAQRSATTESPATAQSSATAQSPATMPSPVTTPGPATTVPEPAPPLAPLPPDPRATPAAAASSRRTAPDPAPKAWAVTEPVPPAGVGPWVRCFTEELRPAGDAAADHGDAHPWRVRAATTSALSPLVDELFPDDPAAGRALAVVGDPADPGACAVALAAAQDAIGAGRLVLITHGPGFTGFCASLHAEHPGLGITVLRVPQSAEGLRAARRHAAAEPGVFRELVIDTAGQPHETVMTPADTAGAGEFPLSSADVVLVSRGAGGAGLALAQVLACCGAPIAVIGREAPGEAGEVDAGLRELRSAGVRMSIETVDVANPAELGRALQRIERRLGPVTAVAHAVGVGGPWPIAELTVDELRAHVAAEAASLHQLASAISIRQLRLIITFGSVAGRYGLAGEGLLALASGSLAERAERMADGIPGCRALHVDWPAWSGPGLGQRASLAERLASSGASPIGIKEGSRLLLKTLGTPDLPNRLAVHGRVGVPGPPPIAVSAPRPRDPRLPGRFLEEIQVHYPGVELVCDARLSVRTDPYLAGYQVDGMTALPAVMALEAMAEAASALTGRPMRRLTDVRMEAPVVVPAGADAEPAVIRICALRDGDSVTAVIRCAESGFGTEHFRATFRGADDEEGPAAGAAAGSLAASLPDLDEMPATDAGIVDGTELYGPVCFQSGPFRRAALLPEVTTRSCRALVSGGDGEPWFCDTDGGDASLVLGSPGLNDATWHVLQASVPHRRLLPGGCASVTFSGRTADGAVEIRAAAAAGEPAGAAGKIPTGSVPGPRSGAPAVVVPAQGGSPDAARPSPAAQYVWDVEAVDSAGQVLVTWHGLRLADAGPLPRTAAWPPSLLSVYLERSAVALGLNAGLRLSVHSVQPEAASGLIPRPSPAPDREPGGADGEPGQARSARGTGQLEGFVLTVRAPEATACAWEVADPAGSGAAGTAGTAASGAASAADPEPGPTDLEARLRSALAVLGEPPNTTAALLDAIAACLVMAGAPGAPVAPADGVAQDGWLSLRAGQAALAGTVVQISGVSCPVAIAVLTGDATLEDQAPYGQAPDGQAADDQAADGQAADDQAAHDEVRDEEGRGDERPAGTSRRQRRAAGAKNAARKSGSRRQNAATTARRGQSGSPPD